MEILVTIGYIAICVVMFSLAIAIHEFGHFIAALKLGLKVERFSIGFGPAIWKKTFRGVEYRISWIPLGGYVSIPDVDNDGVKAIEQSGGSGQSVCVRSIAPWKELVVAFAGPAMNLVLAAVIAFLLASLPSVRFGQRNAQVDCLIPGGPADKAGILPGDTIIDIGGHAIHSWTDMLTEVQITDCRPTDFTILREGKTLVVRVVPERDAQTGVCFIAAASTNGVAASPWMPSRNPLRQLAWDAGSIFRALKGLVTPGEIKATSKALGGPIRIAEGIYGAVRHDFCDGLGFLRFLNVNLAVINLLPIPVLDGGLILFALFAIVFRRRVPEKIVGALSTGFMYLLLALMGVLIVRDSMRSWRIHHRDEAPASETETTNRALDDAPKNTDQNAENR